VYINTVSGATQTSEAYIESLSKAIADALHRRSGARDLHHNLLTWHPLCLMRSESYEYEHFRYPALA
jgi:hypothetical protein